MELLHGEGRPKRDERPLCARKRADFRRADRPGDRRAGMADRQRRGQAGAAQDGSGGRDGLRARRHGHDRHALRPRRRAASGADCRARGRRVLRCGSGRGRAACPRRGIPKGNGGLCAVRGWQRPPRLGGLRGRGGRGDAGHARNGRRAGENPAFRRDGGGGDGRSAAGGRFHGGRREARRRRVSRPRQRAGRNAVRRGDGCAA